jgi:hypothetical protein
MSSGRKRPNKYDMEYDAGRQKKKKMNGANASWNPERKHQFQHAQDALRRERNRF